MEIGELRNLVKRAKTLSQKLSDDGPQTDDELHEWLKQNLRLDIPRYSVCPDHQSPFEFFADVYFERLKVEIDGVEYPVNGALALANRGGFKTTSVAALHFTNCTFKPGCGCLSFGATAPQGMRTYANVEEWGYEHDPETGRRTDQVRDFLRDVPRKSHTEWRTGSEIEVVSGTEESVSGPHPQKAHADEIDQMLPGQWAQSRGMAVSRMATGPLPNFMAHMNGIIPPQNIATSTRNSLKGLMQELLDEIEEDLASGNIPRYIVYIWCIWETLAEVPMCRSAPKEEREARLTALGRDPKELCICHKVNKGKLKQTVIEDGEEKEILVERTLDKVCAGKAFKGRGVKPYQDLITAFKENPPGNWVLQHECREGRDENVYIKDWDLTTYGIRNYEPRPEYGPIYMGIDWGGTNPYAVLWLQYLHVDVPGWDFNYDPVWLNKGIYVAFREIYAASTMDTGLLASRVIRIESEYRDEYPGWNVRNRFADPQGRGDRLLFNRKGLKTTWPIKTRQKEKFITAVQNLVIDDRFVVDTDQCEMFTEEVEVWQQNPNTKKEVDQMNHLMSAWRYAIANADFLENPERDKEVAQRQEREAETRRQSGVKKLTPAEMDETNQPVIQRHGAVTLEHHMTDWERMNGSLSRNA